MMSCDLSDWIYLSIAGEVNPTSETAFIEADGGEADYKMRWLSSKREIPLCGHGAPAEAHILFDELAVAEDPISSKTMIGIVHAERATGGVLLDFLRSDTEKVDPPLRVLKAMGIEAWDEALYSDGNQKLVVLLDEHEQVGEIHSDYRSILASRTLSVGGGRRHL
ncbi:MAG: PhzF family phenazine biosynthesis protein [Candidatus Bathyarchaeia archaeon]